MTPVIPVGKFGTIVLVSSFVGSRHVSGSAEVKLSGLLCIVVQALLASSGRQQSRGLDRVGGRASGGGGGDNRSCRAVGRSVG